MRIVAFGDVHMALNTWPETVGSKPVDLVVLTGDLTNFGDRLQADQVLKSIRARHQGPLLALPGNLDHRDVDAFLTEQGINLHGRGFLLNGVGLFGVGGSNITPFHTPLELTEEEIAHLLRAAYAQVQGASHRILISHAPPYGTRADRLGNGAHAGSRAVRDFIEEVQPELCLCGHIHEARSEDRLGKTLVLNPGMSKDGGWVGIIIDQQGLRAGLELSA